MAVLVLTAVFRMRNHNSSSQVVPSTPDVLVRNEGTVFLFCPLSSRGKQWIEEHVQPDAQWFGSALIVEHRFAWGLAQGPKDARLVLA
jgi:hypothetical protein